MTNLKALQAELNRPMPEITLELALLKNNLDADATYVVPDNIKPVEVALAGLILTIAMSPKSVKELDYQVTEHDMDDLLKLRLIIIKRYGLVDELAEKENTVTGRSPW
ncbi:hypothetical protein AY601_4084 [Pedobacter cryoconitis]|uniref:Uncharacterized protein n=1 Tax=Pedobacter cryoconitis TaxID=188932 RepID=A0A127VHY2_9SPHI|nr:DUF6706 family protein [Pedobacter cryoconitis]AMQ00935.1 hypothetical protein AY601_4084 [Pedobacter cryoconitis]